MEIEYGNLVIEVPEGTTPEQLPGIISGLQKTPAFDSLVDKKLGAPARVRTLVGSAPPQDKLANLQQFYPDATPYGEDNFVFTDPGTGRPTLFNPTGIDAGDIFGVAREITQFVGGTLGAAGGAIAGGTMSSPTIVGIPFGAVGGAVAGSGVGSATGGALFDVVTNVFMDRIDTRTAPQVMLDTTLDMAAGAAGEGAGNLVSAGVRRAVAGSKPAVQKLVDAFERLQITPPAAAVSGSRAVQTMAKALESSPFSSDIIYRQADTVLAQTKAAADKIAADLGPVRTQQGAGGVIKAAAQNAAERFGFKQDQIYTEAFDLIGADTPVAVNSIRNLRIRMENKLAGAPESLEKSLGPAIRQLQSLEADAAANGGIPFSALREIRTAVGKDLDAPVLAGATSSQNSNLKLVYGALTEDLSAAAQAAGGDAAKKLAVADRYTRAFMNTSNATLEKINRFDADERAFEFAMTSSKDGGTALSRLRRNFLPEEWDVVAGTVFHRLGMARPGSQDAAGEVFSVSKFMTEWNKLAPEAKEALFGGSRYAKVRPAIDDLVKVIDSLKDVEKMTNTSNTARALFTLTVLGSLGSGAGAALSGDVQGAGVGLTTIILGGLSAKGAAKLMTSEKFIRWMTRGPSSMRDISAHMNRLGAIAVAEPEIAEEIGQFVSTMRSVSSEGRQPTAQ